MKKIVTNIKKLRKVSKEIHHIDAIDVSRKLHLTLYHTDNCMALCAPQIGILKRIILTSEKYQGLEILNPEIIKTSREKTKGLEGCLSIPETMIDRIMVPRYKRIKLKYLDRFGNMKIEKFNGLLARCIQHEIDHLNGILITDYKERI